MRLTFWGIYESDYPRNRIFSDALRDLAEDEINIAHRPVFEKKRDKSGRFLGFISLLLLAINMTLAYLRLTFAFFMLRRKTDVFVCGYPGHLDVIVLHVLLRLTNTQVPVLFNPLISLYDTLVLDRQKYMPDTLMARMIRKLDHLAFAYADHIIIDTRAHKQFLQSEFKLHRDKVSVIFVGAEPQFFRPKVKLPPHRDRTFIIQFVGKLIPLHGIEHILDAAMWFSEADVIFEIIGSGQLDGEFRSGVRARKLRNIRHIPWVEYAELPQKMRESHLSLGVFSGNSKTARVIPNKVFQALALGRVVLTAKTPAIAELQSLGVPIATVSTANGKELAKMIQMIIDSYEDMGDFARQAKKLARETFAPAILVRQFREVCRSLLESQNRQNEDQQNEQQ
jgi:glycosyltransferase involved in cell wall biosynthesis